MMHRTPATLLLLAMLLLTGYSRQTRPTAKPTTPSDSRGLGVRQMASGLAPDGKGQLWAVVVGVSEYKNVPPEGQLRYAHRDAEDFAAFLRSPSGGGFPSNHIKLLLNKEATVSAIRTAIGTWLVRSAEPDDVIYIFFAGHGVVESDTDGYLLAHDSDPQNLYATALQIAELDRIITQRLRARLVVLMADACHSGQIGWASRGTTDRTLITNYLDEVGKSGSGVTRILATRANERSFEDVRWGGGHGAFTHFLLEGLKGKADRDKDGFVRVGEVLDYLSEVVPQETQALQHPRMAGSVDPRLPLSILSPDKGRQASDASIPSAACQLEIRGTPGSEVYIDNTYRGRIRPNGLLVIDDLNPERHEVSIDPPNAESFTQTVSLIASKSVLELRPAARTPAASKSSPLVAQIKQAVAKNRVLEQDGAWPMYKRLVSENPTEPQRASIEIALSTSLEEIGQQAINKYIRSSVLELRATDFRRSADAFRCLRTMNPGDSQLEAKQLFSEARVATDEGRNRDAIASLTKAITLDSRAGHLYNALGVAYEKEKDNERAVDAFKRAAQLAPQWSFPRLHLGIQYYARGKIEHADDEFETAVRLDPRDPFARWWVVRLNRERGRYKEAEKSALDLIAIAPAFASAHVELGLIYEAVGQHARAADELETYIRLAPRSVDTALVGYDLNKIREQAAKNRRLGGGKQPSLKRP